MESDRQLQQIVVDGGFQSIESLEVKLSEISLEEKEILASLLSDGRRLDDVLPDGMDSHDVWTRLVAACKLDRGAAYVGNRLKPIIGRLLILIQRHPELYENLGYSSYEEFMTKGMPSIFGISRSEAYACRRVAERFPSLTIGQFRQIGVAKLYTLASVTKEGEPEADELVRYAMDPEVNRSDLRAKAAEMKGLDGDEFRMVELRIGMTRDLLNRWKSFCNDPAVQLYCAAMSGEQPSEAQILKFMMDECELEWKRRGHELRDRLDMVV